jgi:uncharacterized protein
MFWEDNLILKVLVGSHGYGTNIKGSDFDFRGVCIPPKEYLLGLKKFEQHETKTPDETIFSLEKFVRLALNNNPNILEILFTEKPSNILYVNPIGQELLDLKYDFLSKAVYKTFGGYADAQFKKMLNKSNAEEYDTKNAMHLIRLLKMGIEALNDRHLYVYRLYDASFLNKIREGSIPLSEILYYAKEFEEELNQAYKTTGLPDKPNTEVITEWLVKTQEKFIKGEWECLQ